MKLLSILSLAACVFGTLVAASPVAAPAPITNQLAARDDKDGKPIIDALIKLDVDVDTCTKKWENTCKTKKCGQQDFIDFQAELAVIIELAANDIKGKTPHGFKFLDVTVCINLLVAIFVKINLALTLILTACGYLPSIFISIVLTLCVKLSISLKLLISVLAVVVDGLLIKLTIALGAALGGVLCLVCSLLDIIL